jgi:hemolysin activation/secretion protein
MDITSDETDIGLNLSHPFRVKPNFKLDGFASLTNKKASTDFSDKTLIDYHVDTISLGVSVQTVDSVGFWYSRYEITCGDADYEGDPDASEKPSDFYRLNLAMIRQQKLKNDRSLTYRFSAQLSADKQLPSTETFSLGGVNTIRGCSAGILSGDTGYNFNIEYNFPFRFTDKARGFYFFDHGGTFPYKGNDENISADDFLTSIGLGVNFTYSKYFSGKIVLGVPLNPPDDEDGFRLEFYLQSIIF